MAEDKLSKKPLLVLKRALVAEPCCVASCIQSDISMSDMETLRKAQNDVNANVVTDLYVTLDTFYEKIGLQPTSHSGGISGIPINFMGLELHQLYLKMDVHVWRLNTTMWKPI